LEEHQKEQFFEESKLDATVMGIPPSAYPDNYTFKVYFYDMIRGDYLRVDEPAKSLAKIIFDLPLVPGFLAKLFAAGLLPEVLRKAFELKYNSFQRLIFSVITKLTAMITWLIPYHFGLTPPYYQA